MAKAAMMYCPRCRMVGQNAVELYTSMPEDHIFRCMNNHAFESYAALMAMTPDKIKLVPKETPQANDVKIEVWVDKDIWAKFQEQYPNRVNATVQSILSVHLYGKPIIIDGVQAKRLNELGVRTGQDMVAAMEVSKGLEDQLATAQSQLATYQGLFSQAGINAPA